MYPQRRIMSQALGLGLLVTLVVLALSACGGGGGGSGEEEAKVRHLPEDEKALPPRPIPHGGVQALGLLQGRQGLE
jgi:hypothetical protein